MNHAHAHVVNQSTSAVLMACPATRVQGDSKDTRHLMTSFGERSNVQILAITEPMRRLHTDGKRPDDTKQIP